MPPATDIRACAMEMPRIDTHHHPTSPDNPTDLRETAERFAGLDTGNAVIDSRTHAAGCRELYGIDPGTYLRPDSPPEIFERAARLRARGYVPALHHTLDAAGITTQLILTDHRPDRWPTQGLSPRLRPIATVDPALLGDMTACTPDNELVGHYDALCADLGPLPSLDAYLEQLDVLIDGWRSSGVVGLKTALAYTMGLSIGDPSLARARKAFAKKGKMTLQDSRCVVERAFRHALSACKRNSLPVVVHTGFQIWGHGNLSQSNPMLLHNLLVDKRYKDLTFVLLHGGNPYVGETTYLAAMFPNVVIDFTWISWMTRARFRLALQEWIEAVPSKQICWGSDSGTLETIAGINAITRGQIATVLEGMIQERSIDELAALRFLEDCYQRTPKHVFGL